MSNVVFFACGFLSVAFGKKTKIVEEPISLSLKLPFFMSVFAQKFFHMRRLTIFFFMRPFSKEKPVSKKHFYKINIKENCSKYPPTNCLKCFRRKVKEIVTMTRD